MSKAGRVEILSSEFSSGWAEYRSDNPISVYAKMDDGIIGVARADIKRADLERAFVEQELRAGCFVIVYNKPVPEERMSDVTIHVLETNIELKRAAAIRIDRQPKQQIFVFGSPRSGTSELGDTLAKQLRLPWLGEGHAAPLFARAASSLSGDGNSANGLISDQQENAADPTI